MRRDQFARTFTVFIEMPSVCGEHRVPPPHLSTHGSPCAHLLRRCSTVILLSFDRSPHLITSRCRALPSSLAKASLSMDEAARQTSSHSLCSAASSSLAAVRRPGSSQRQHRRTGSVGTVSEHEVTEALGLAQSTCHLCSSFLSALSVAYYYLYFL